MGRLLLINRAHGVLVRIAFVICVMIVLGLMPCTASAAQKDVEGPASTLRIAATAQLNADSSCALLAADGNFWRCTSTGQAVSKYWDGGKSRSELFNPVKTIFIASNVEALVSQNAYWSRYVSSSGSISDYRYSVTLSYGFPNVTTISFLTDGNGVNACQIIDDSAVSYASALTTVANFNKTKVMRIGEYAFSRTGITTLSVPPTLKTIAKSAFSNCAKLQSVNGLAKTKLSSLGQWSFQQCKRLGSISLPISLKTVGDSSFYDCTNLKSVTFGAKLAKIGDYAFHNCEKLKAVDLPASCKKMGSGVFYGCDSLKKVVLRSKTVVKNAGTSKYMGSCFRSTPVEVKGNRYYIYVPGSMLSKYRSTAKNYNNPWWDYRTKFRAIPGTALKSIAKVKVGISSQKYRKGKAVKPRPKYVKDGGKKLKIGRDYKIVKYGNNKKVGKKAWLQIKGIGKYTGTKKIYFKIRK